MSQLIVLTGATRGLGRALAAEFVARGYTVAGCGRDESRLAPIRAEHPSPSRFDAVDVADVSAVDTWAAKILESLGPPAFLVANAALINRNAPLWEVPPQEFSQLVDVNLKGVYHVVRAFAPAMVRAGRGVIVNLSSYWGRSTSPEVAPYCASKFAVEGLTRSLAQELPKGMAAVALNPGIIDTDMLRSCFGDGAGRYLAPAEWAQAAAPFILGLGAADNGKSLTVPGQ